MVQVSSWIVPKNNIIAFNLYNILLYSKLASNYSIILLFYYYIIILLLNSFICKYKSDPSLDSLNKSNIIKIRFWANFSVIILYIKGYLYL